jgi:hypothetical protein
MAIHGARHEPGERALRDYLAELEACFGTPVIPGSLAPWLEAIEAALGELEPVLRHQVNHGHRAQLSLIERAEAGSPRSVDHLKREDQELLAAFVSLKAEAARLSALATDVEPDEAVMNDDVARFASAGLWFVIRVRRQNTAIRTWLGESFNRESGAGD